MGIITGTAVRPDLILVDRNNNICVIELTVGHESTTKSNADRKAAKYKHLMKNKEIKGAYNKVNFVNRVLTFIGVIFCMRVKDWSETELMKF